MQKTAYEMRISDWSSDVCSSDLRSDRKFGRLSDLTNLVGHGFIRICAIAGDLCSKPRGNRKFFAFGGEFDFSDFRAPEFGRVENVDLPDMRADGYFRSRLG